MTVAPPPPDRPAGAARANGRQTGRGPSSRPARWATALAVGVAVAAAACLHQPRVPREAPPPPPAFERAPYVQAVTGDRAVVLWRAADTGATSGFRYRPAGGAWRRAEVRRSGGGDRRVELRGLPSDSAVDYTVESGGEEVGPFRFRTAPPDTATGTVDVLAFGDSGWGSEAQLDLAALMEERRWDLAVHVGDVAYPDGSEEDFTQRHFRVYRTLLACVPVFPSPGNHDVRPAGGGGAAYDRAFAWPGEERGGRYYAFRRGRAQFLSLDTSSDSAMSALEDREGPQYRWLADTLATLAEDTTLTWTVVFTHRPLYTSAVGFGRNPPTEELREALEPLFLEHGVDLVLAGHDHHYQRTRPLRRGRVVDPGCGPVHFVTGGGGASRVGRSVAPGPGTARISRAYHFLDLALGPGVGSGTAVGRDGEALDRFRIVPYEPGTAACGDRSSGAAAGRRAGGREDTAGRRSSTTVGRELRRPRPSTRHATETCPPESSPCFDS